MQLVGIAEWLMPGNCQLRSWQVFMESEDNVKKWNGRKEGKHNNKFIIPHFMYMNQVRKRNFFYVLLNVYLKPKK